MPLKLNGSTSGYVIVDAPAVAGTTNITLPAVTGGSFVVSDASGNVGIGTSSPITVSGRNLNLYNPSGVQATIQLQDTTTGTTNADGFQIQVNGSNSYVWNLETGPLIFGTANAERARIDSSGNLLIGLTSNPSGYRLLVDSNGIGSAGQHGLIYSTNEFNFAKNLGSTSDIYINYRATSGAYTVSGYRFLNAGPSTYVPLYASAFTVSSDYRLKKDIQPMTGGIDFINKLRPVTFNWIENNEPMDGFIAHEVQEIAPYAVHGEKDAVDPEKGIVPQGLDSAKLVARLVAAVQELSAKVDAQAAEITALKAKVGA